MAPSPIGENRAPRRILAVACWAGLWLLYEVLAGGWDAPEVVVGGLAALAAAVAVFVAGPADHLGRMPRGWWWLLIRRVAPRVIPETMRVLASAVGSPAPSGRIVRSPFEVGGDDPVSGSRRAMVVLGASIAPNSYVIAIGRGRDELLTHELLPEETSPSRGDSQWPL